MVIDFSAQDYQTQNLMSTSLMNSNNSSVIIAYLKNGKNEQWHFYQFPFTVEFEENTFSKPPPEPQPDITCLTPDQLNKFVQQCNAIKNQLNDHMDENDEI